MSGLLNTTLNGSTSNLPDSTGRPFTTSFSGQSAATPGFHHSASLQGLHNIHGSFNLPNMAGSLGSRNVSISSVPSGGVQQAGGSISSGRFASNNLPVALSQMSHGSSVTNRGGINVVGSPAFSSSMNGIGGSLTGISSNSANSVNRSSVPGLGVSPILGNVSPRLSSSINNMVGGGNLGRNIGSGGLSVPSLASRLNLAANSGTGSINAQGANRLMTSMLQQGMLGNPYATSGGPLSQGQVQGGNNTLSSMGMINDMNANDTSPFDMNDFPQLSARPSSAGGPQGQLGSMRKQGVGVNSIVQQNQEFSIQNEDFPALPGYKGGSTDFSVDMRQKEPHDNISMMQSQHFPMARSTGFNLGGTYPANRQQQQQHATAVSGSGFNFAPGNNQDLLRLHGPELYPSSHGSYHSQIQSNGAPNIGLRPLNSPSPVSGLGAYEQLIQQYQHQNQNQNQSQFRLQQMSSVAQSYRDQNVKPIQGTQTTVDRFAMLGLLSVVRTSDTDLTSLALGIDLTTLGLSLNSSDNLHKTFLSPWSNEASKGEPEYSIPDCYYSNPSPPIHQGHFSKFQLSTLFYIFYSMPKDEMQLYAASELCSRGWFYHKEHKLWFTRVTNMEPLVKTNAYERGSYLCFDLNTWDTVPKENFVLHYDQVEKKPTLP